jgi:Mrp family chromosome partitioning ATPase
MFRAMSCERMAGVVMDDAVQTVYLNLAAQWRDLARQVEMWDMDRDKPASEISN